MKPASVLVLLVALAFRLLGGFHPCHLQQEEARPAARPVAAEAPCHGMAPETSGAKTPRPARHGDPQAPCCNQGCESGCLLLAAVPASPLADGAPLAGTVAESRPQSPHPPYLSPLDHVPLA